MLTSCPRMRFIIFFLFFSFIFSLLFRSWSDYLRFLSLIFIQYFLFSCHQQILFLSNQLYEQFEVGRLQNKNQLHHRFPVVFIFTAKVGVQTFYYFLFNFKNYIIVVSNKKTKFEACHRIVNKNIFI